MYIEVIVYVGWRMREQLIGTLLKRVPHYALKTLPQGALVHPHGVYVHLGGRVFKA